MTSLIQCTGVWISGGSKFGLSWKLVQSMITELPQNTRSFTFVDDSDVTAPRTSQKKTAAQTYQEDEEEEEEEEEFVPPPRKAVPAAPVAPVKQPVSQTLDDAEDDEADDAEPIPVPKTKKLLPKKAGLKK
jgi:hypothetical protein